MDEEAALLPERRGKEEQYVSDEFDRASFTGTVFNLSTTIIGAGIMALPATMKVLGVGLGITVVILVAVLTGTSIEMLSRFSKVKKSVSYGDVMGDAFGSVGKVLLQICILVGILGVLVAYMIIIGDVLSGTLIGVHRTGVLEGWFGEQWWTGRTFVLCVITLAVFAPLACFKRIVHTMENELEDSSLMQPAVQTSLALCSTVYMMVGIFGLLLFSESTLDDVLANFDTNLGIPYSWLLNDAVRVSYALHLMFVFPVLFHPLRLNLDSLLFPSARPLVSDNHRFTLISIVLMFLILLGANFIPGIWDAFQFTGASTAVCVGFIFPAAIALRDPHGIATKKDKIISVLLIIFALFSNLVAVYSDACALFKKNASPHV